MNFGLEQVNQNIANTGPGVFSLLLAIFAIVVFAFVLLALARFFLRRWYNKNQHQHQVVMLVRLPKDRPGDKEQNFTTQQLHEEIAKGETIFASIGGLAAKRGLMAWFFGRDDNFSFEIVAQQKRIFFYVVVPLGMERYIEQQIHAYYPDAVIEPQEDYNIFSRESQVLAGFLKTKKQGFLPLKTYLKQETDSMNSIVNVMSKLSAKEGLAIQYTVRSARAAWHQKAHQIVNNVHKGKTLKEALLAVKPKGIFGVLSELVSAAKPPPKKMDNTQTPHMTETETEILKGIEEKNSKAGLNVNIRIIVSAANKGQAKIYLDNLASAFSHFNYFDNGNSFNHAIKIKHSPSLIQDFIYRRFDERISFLLNTEELASLYHFPLKNTETPNIAWLSAKHAPAPSNVPGQGLLLGYNFFRGQKTPINIKRDDRRRHAYIIGKSGVGKSVLLANMAVQDINNGEGVCVIDPHGDLISDILSRVPPSRAEDVILFAPADTERPLALNLLEYDSNYPEQKTFVINEMIKIFDKMYDLKSTGGPIFEQYIRNAMLLVMSHPESGSTLMEIPKVLSDPAFRNFKLKKCSDRTVVDFWRKEAEKAGGDAALANVVPYVTSKLTQFISNDTMRPIIAQQKSSFNLRDVMDKRKILLVDLSKGQVGEMNAHLLGMILVGKILMAALSRTDISNDERKDFYLYIDEFQNFTTDSISSILSEARKYRLNLTIAHQYLGQLVNKQDTSIRDAVFGNVGSWLLFKIGSEDAEVLEKEFSPVFNKFDLLNIEKYTAYVKLLIDNTASRAFSMKTVWPIPGISQEGTATKIKTLSRLKYGQDRRLIEAEIRRREENSTPV